MKIVYLTSRFPYPLDKGDKLRAYHQIKNLSEKYEVHLICISDKDHSKNDLEEIRAIVYSLHVLTISPFERYVSLFKSIFSETPFQIAWFYDPQLDLAIQNICKDIHPDHVFCQLARMGEYAKHLPYPKTLDYMDCFSVSMQKRASVSRKWIKKLYLIEAQRMHKYEIKIAQYFDHLTIISQQDKAYFSFPNSHKIHIIPNGISKDFFDLTQLTKPEFDLVFVGNMSYLPNIESVEYLAEQVLPLCGKHVKLLIAGTNPAQRVKTLQSDQVRVVGWVKDIRTAYKNAKIFVAPMWSGTGQQNKILEAMAMSLPCITTGAVNNAIGAAKDHEIMIAESADAFAAHIDFLLKNPEIGYKMGSKGRQFVKEHYDWKQISEILSSILQ